MLKNNYGKKILQILPYAAIALVAASFFVRAFYGFDWSDECYNLALPYRFALGSRAFIDSWDADQTYALLLAPVLWLYRLVVGNMDGILLFMRLLFVLVQTAVSLLVYRVMLKLCGSRTVALVAAAICLSFAPYSISSFSYYTLSCLLMIVAAMLVISLYLTESTARITVLSTLAGVTYACACVAFPCCIAVLPSFILLLCAVRPRVKKQEGSQKTLRALAFFLSGFLFIGILVCGYLFVTVGLDEISKNISYLFYDPDHKPVMIVDKIFHFIRDYYNLMAVALMQLFFLAILFLFKYVKLDVGVKYIFAFLIRVCMPLCIVANIIIILIEPVSSSPFIVKINQIQVCAGLWPLVLFANKPSRKNAIVMLSLYVPANLMCLAFYLSNSKGINEAPCTLILAVLSICPMLYEYYVPLIQMLKKKPKKNMAYLLQAGLIILAVFVIGSSSILRVETVYRDSSLSKLTVQMQSGPAKGIYTTPTAAANYEGIVADISASVPKNSTVLFTGLLPFGYLCTDQPPAAPSLWRTQFDSDRLASYYRKYPTNRPTFIYIVKKQYGYVNGNNKPDLYSAQKNTDKNVTQKETKYSYQYIVSK